MRILLFIYVAIISNQLMAQKRKVEIDTIKTDKNRYSVRVYSSFYYDLKGISYDKLKYDKIKGKIKETKYYRYSIKNLSNKIDVWALQKKYTPKGYDYFNPYYTASKKSRFLLDSLIRLSVGEETLKKSFFDNNDTTGYIQFSVIYDLAGKVAEVTEILFRTFQPAKYDIKDVEKMEEIIKTYADFVPNVTSDNSKTAMAVYPKINYFDSEYHFYFHRYRNNSKVQSNHPKSIEIPKFIIQPKAN
jgi:hypothetical protein